MGLSLPRLKVREWVFEAEGTESDRREASLEFSLELKSVRWGLSLLMVSTSDFLRERAE